MRTLESRFCFVHTTHVSLLPLALANVFTRGLFFPFNSNSGHSYLLIYLFIYKVAQNRVRGKQILRNKVS